MTRTEFRQVAPTRDRAGSRYLDRPHVLAAFLRVVRDEAGTVRHLAKMLRDADNRTRA